ncbi:MULTISPECIES: glycosyltransferase family 4 protein [unclassified Bacillus (in: firmicutes)]|uniref:glycosyltransferase family 4 protein n=1 Tax=unclassified Bacillus (in: firmicutes) TaxID=185979 RepID=UPI0023DCB2D4|nr:MULTISPECIES: glycosyltransferase family 4 protein [unclassified Bacillus (in: firmicutes)]MCU4755842.1 glycosyltransferase family 4 protein [Bacillus cereus]MDF2021638.1 glycosyltransferase family 4 protein [Bacillus sp. Cr_R3]MDF2035000.1 glycosyltransferase family 4 protein [Bacillus sp. Cr_R16]HDR7435205.1 glycosyltransferase family 4 protein [Bacillus anthracis]
MNILLMTDKLITGGAESYFCKLESNLRYENFTVYTAAGEGELYESLTKKENFMLLSRWNHLRNIHYLRKEICKRKIELIHANSLRMVLYAFLLQKFVRRKIKVVYTKHNVTILEKKMPTLFRYFMNKYVNNIITVSEFEKNNLISMYVAEEKIKTIYNGVDIEKFLFQQKKKESTYNVGILARLSKEKNHQLFVKIANVLKERNDFKFYIAGDGPEKESIMKEIEKYGLQQSVKMLGNISDPHGFIGNMDALLLLSFREVFPMVVIEAMATGTPIVSIDVGGINEAVINGKSGVLIHEYCESEFASALEELQGNEEKANDIRLKAREKAERYFSLTKMIEETKDIYELNK